MYMIANFSIVLQRPHVAARKTHHPVSLVVSGHHATTGHLYCDVISGAIVVARDVVCVKGAGNI